MKAACGARASLSLGGESKATATAAHGSRAPLPQPIDVKCPSLKIDAAFESTGKICRASRRAADDRGGRFHVELICRLPARVSRETLPCLSAVISRDGLPESTHAIN